jgi:hypothetical protein
MRHLLLIWGLLSLATTSWAKQVAGIEIAESVSLPGNTVLMLNGAGIRSKFIFDIYVGALYVSKPPLASSESVINDQQAQRVSMHFLYDEVSKDKLNDGWQDGFDANHSKTELAKLSDRLADFKQLFVTVKKGDVINLDYLPEQGTLVSINNQTQGTVPGFDFHQALMKVWLGDIPADSNLKNGMLGQ